MKNLKAYRNLSLLVIYLLSITFWLQELRAADKPVVRNNLRVKAILKEDSPIYSKPSTSSSSIDNGKQYSIVFVF